MIQAAPPTVSQNLKYAKSALRKGESLAAIVHLKLALAAEPENAEVLELLGIAHEKEGDRTAALEALAAATETDPRRASAHYNYALVLSEAAMLDEALEEVQAALMIRPTYSAASDLHASIARRLKDRFCRSDEDFAVDRKSVV